MKQDGDFSFNSDDFYEEQLVNQMQKYKMKQKYYEKMLRHFKQSRNFSDSYPHRENLQSSFSFNPYTQSPCENIHEPDNSSNSCNVHMKDLNLRTIFQPNLRGKYLNFFNKR